MATRNSFGLALQWILVLGLMTFAAEQMVSEAQAAKFKNCKDLYRKLYLKGEKHKAFATTGGRSMTAYSTACGASEGFASKKIAISNALQQCRDLGRRNKTPGKCKIIEVK